ncbi:DUF3142 domain-containing protein [bacterium]|nr:DUF3142 domain-containing protein [bacterium]
MTGAIRIAATAACSITAVVSIASAVGLPQEIYVWQRAWTPAVVDSIRDHGKDFAALPVLAIEVGWDRGKPAVTQIPVDFNALKAAGVSAYPVLRVGVYTGSFELTAPATQFLCKLSREIIDEWTAHGAAPTELQLDFDCPTSKLADFQLWVKAIRAEVSPIKCTITALPTWLGSPAFEPLAQATDGFVLQVHSFQPPKSADEPYALCDPAKAREYVSRAGRIGVPFRVALPTYGYRLIFAKDGTLKGLAAEGSVKDWPEDTLAREVHADPAEMAVLVRTWKNERPNSMKGIIWYRLPNRDDDLNWPWPTLTSVMAGRVPKAGLSIEAQNRSTGLTELIAINRGNGSATLPDQIKLHWTNARLIAGDGLGGYELQNQNHDGAVLRQTRAKQSLEPGTSKPAGWIRLNQPTEVKIEY